MKLIYLFPLLTLLSPTSFAQDLIPLRACAMTVSKNIDETKISEGWSSDDEKSFLFLNCDDDYVKGEDHYVFTPNGVYYFYIKAHKDYKGGFEGTQFRLSLENKTYYFKSNIVAGMGNLYDQTGNNLSASSSVTDPDSKKIDPSSKNVVLNYYMKVITGRPETNASVVAEPVTPERALKAQACIQKRILRLSKSLVDVYNSRSDYRQVDPSTLSTYKAFVQKSLLSPACSSDPALSETLIKMLNDLHS